MAKGLVARWGRPATRWGASRLQSSTARPQAIGAVGSATNFKEAERRSLPLLLTSRGVDVQESLSNQHFGVPALCLACAQGCGGPGRLGDKSPPTVRSELAVGGGLGVRSLRGAVEGVGLGLSLGAGGFSWVHRPPRSPRMEFSRSVDVGGKQVSLHYSLTGLQHFLQP